MSKKAKKANKEKNLQKKRAMKQANKARYATLKAHGQNTKSLRAVKSNKRSKLVNRTKHIEGKCGNIGCNTCNTKRVNKKTVSIKLHKYLYEVRFQEKFENAVKHDTMHNFLFNQLNLN